MSGICASSPSRAWYKDLSEVANVRPGKRANKPAGRAAGRQEAGRQAAGRHACRVFDARMSLRFTVRDSCWSPNFKVCDARMILRFTVRHSF